MLTRYIVRPSYSNCTRIESRVKPASGPTRTRSSCNIAFSRVDFPTFGRPTMANCNGNLVSSSLGSSTILGLLSSLSSSKMRLNSKTSPFLFYFSLLYIINRIPTDFWAKMQAYLNVLLEILR